MIFFILFTVLTANSAFVGASTIVIEGKSYQVEAAPTGHVVVHALDDDGFYSETAHHGRFHYDFYRAALASDLCTISETRFTDMAGRDVLARPVELPNGKLAVVFACE